MTPGTKVNWYDNSALQVANDIPDIQNKSLFMVVSSFDKGPEDLREVYGTDFVKLYGNPLYSKHGQNGIQAKRIIDAGGKLLVKRICAEDAKLANTVLCATVASTTEQKKNADGELLYLDDNGVETTTVTSNPANAKSTTVKWEAKTIESCASFEDAENAAMNLLDEAAGVYPVILCCDNGRGTSSKSVKFNPDYNTSKSIGNMFYGLSIYEGTTLMESETMSLDPAVIYSKESYALDRSSCEQIEAEVIVPMYEKYVAKIADELGSTVDVVRNYDLIFCYNTKGGEIPGFSIDPASIDLNSSYGIELKSGSNGAFGDTPAFTATDIWAEAMRKVYAGEVTDEVWDVDAHKIAAIVDANLPLVVKNAIIDFVNWREDCVFFRDFGTGLTSYLDIISYYKANITKFSKFVANYSSSYTIKDPNTYKNIEVTMMYDLAAKLVNHFDTSVCAPLAGVYNGFVLESAIKGTLNFTPITTPSVNQKDAFEEMHVNYAIFNDDQCVVQSCYTSNEKYTELSYVNNVLAIQEVVRALRTMCPRQRYKLVTGSDLTDYATACQNVLENFIGNFNTLKFTYTEDKIKSAQKIFYASIEFSFNQWAQTEIFDVYALNSYNM